MKLRKLFYSALTLLFIGFFIPFKITDKELVSYENEFLELAAKHCKRYQYLNPIQKTLVIEKLPPLIIGTCRTNGISYMHIKYSEDYWRHETEDSKTVTLFHEFFHCYFGVGHSEDPENFMYAFEMYIPKQVMLSQAEQLLKQLCKDK